MRKLAHCGVHRHKPGCRPARPLCKLMRKVQPQRRVCFCGAYWFPHRAGSDNCGKPEALWDIVYAPNTKAAE